MTTKARSRAWMVAAAIVLFLEGDSFLEADAFVRPSGLATHRRQLPGMEDPVTSNDLLTPLQSFKFIKGETSYGDISEGSSYSGMLGGPSSVGFGGTSRLGGNSLSRGRNRRANSMWWSRFSQQTPTTLLAVGSLESWPVMEADDIQVLVKKGDDLENDPKMVNSGYDNGMNSGSSSKSVKATLERWENDIALEVIGQDGYPMLGNQMQPGQQYNSNGNGSDNGRCTQSIKFDVSDGDVYPFSGTFSVPPPLTVEDSMGTQQTVMMVLNNPDDDDEFNQGGYQQQQYDDYGNEIPKSKPSAVEAKLEPLYKSPDQKYAEAQQQQQQQMQYDEWGNEVYNPQQQQQQYNGQDQKATIPSNGSQSFELDATNPSSGKIKISLEREEGGGGFGGFGGGGGNSEARVEIYHGFKDQYGNPYNNNFGDEEEDKRISLEVSTMHPTFSSIMDTMPANLLAKHALPQGENLDFVQPYLEVRIVNTGGQSLKAGVQNFLPQYKPQNQQQRSRQQYEKQKYEQRLALGQTSSIKADNAFLLSDSTQSTTSSRRMKDYTIGVGGREKSYVRASSRNSNTRINEMFSTGSSPSSSNNYNNNNYYTEDQGMARPSQDRYNFNGQYGSSGVKFDNPTDMVRPAAKADGYNNNRVMQARRNNQAKDYYGYDVIDTIATSSRALVANNDFTKANGSKTSAIVPGSPMFRAIGGSGNYRGLQSYGGNSGGAGGMQQPFQGRSHSQSFGNNGGSSMFQGRPSQQQSFGNNGMQQQQSFGGNGMQEQQSFGNNGGNSMFQGRSSQQQSFGNNGMQRQSFGGNGMQEQQSFGNKIDGNSMFQQQSFGNNGMEQQQSFLNSDMEQESFGRNGMQRNGMQRNGMQRNGMQRNGMQQNERKKSGIGGSIQQVFSSLTSPKKTRTVKGQRGSSSAFSGNGNVIGNGVIAGRPPRGSTTVGNNNNRMMRNNRNLDNDFGSGGFSGRDGEFRQQQRLNPRNRNMNNNDSFENAQSSSFQSSFTPEASNNFGGRSNGRNNGRNNGGGFGQGSSNSNGRMGLMNQQLEDDDSFSNEFGNSRNNNRNQQQGGILKNPFGGNSNNNNNLQRNGGRMNNNRFGGNSNSNNDNDSFGGSQNGGRMNNNRFGGNSNSNNDNDSFGGSQNGGRMNNSRFGGNSNSNNGNDSFGGSQNGGRMNNNRFGGNSNSNNDNDSFGGSQNGGRMNNNGFGGNSNRNNGNNSFGGSQNNSRGFGGAGKNGSGSPFGNVGSPPQTKGNTKNPFAALTGESTQQQNRNGYSNSNNSFGSGGGAGQRPLSPNPSAMKNPFAGLNGNKNNQYSGRSTTAMRSSNNRDYGAVEDDNPIVGFAKNLVKGIGDLGNR